MNGTPSTRARSVPFKNSKRHIGDLDAATAGRVIASAADIALVLRNGVITDVALGTEELCREGYDRVWRDKPWIDTVTIESRAKIEDLLRGTSSGPRWRQVNHPATAGPDVPVQYTAVKADGDDRVVAFGRDVRATARLQQRLVEVHQSLERDYARRRQAEARYELLFQSISEPVLIVDPDTLDVEEINPAAAQMLDSTVEALRSTRLDRSFAPRSANALMRLVAESASVGVARGTMRLASGSPCDLTLSAFREGDSTRIIVRLAGDPEAGAQVGDVARTRLLRVLDDLPDGLVVAGSDLRIISVNRAFASMTQTSAPAQIVGGRVSDFLGRSPTELNVLVSNLKSHGAVRNFATVLRDRFGREEDVDISAVASPNAEPAAYGFSIRSVARRLRSAPAPHERLPSSADQLTDLVGRVPLKEIVRESTEFIEKLCIEAALEITGDNRASAAEMLGLSRQGFYSKMRRFGLDDAR